MLEKVQKWVSEQGYPLEMRAAKEFRAAGFDVRQAQLYSDFGDESLYGKSREIDLIAVDRDLSLLTRIFFSVECKSSSKPWILFSLNQIGTGHDLLTTYAVMTQATHKALAEVVTNEGATSNGPSPLSLTERLRWMRKDHQIGYTIRQAFSETDNAYAALVSATKAAKNALRPEGYSRTPPFIIAFPLIVIDAPLVRCSLKHDGDLLLEEVDVGEVLFTVPDQERLSTCVRVVRIESLPTFLKEACGEIKQLRAELQQAERTAWADLFLTSYPEPES